MVWMVVVEMRGRDNGIRREHYQDLLMGLDVGNKRKILKLGFWL